MQCRKVLSNSKLRRVSIAQVECSFKKNTNNNVSKRMFKILYRCISLYKIINTVVAAIQYSQTKEMKDLLMMSLSWQVLAIKVRLHYRVQYTHSANCFT